MHQRLNPLHCWRTEIYKYGFMILSYVFQDDFPSAHGITYWCWKTSNPHAPTLEMTKWFLLKQTKCWSSNNNATMSTSLMWYHWTTHYIVTWCYHMFCDKQRNKANTFMPSHAYRSYGWNIDAWNMKIIDIHMHSTFSNHKLKLSCNNDLNSMKQDITSKHGAITCLMIYRTYYPSMPHT